MTISESEVESFVRQLFNDYKEAVFSKNYEKVRDLYDEHAVLEDSSVHYSPDEIVKTIKKYHDQLADIHCENYDEKFYKIGPSLVYSSKFKTNNKDVQEGTYDQFWRQVDGKWKIFRDQVVVFH